MMNPDCRRSRRRRRRRRRLFRAPHGKLAAPKRLPDAGRKNGGRGVLRFGLAWIANIACRWSRRAVLGVGGGWGERKREAGGSGGRGGGVRRARVRSEPAQAPCERAWRALVGGACGSFARLADLEGAHAQQDVEKAQHLPCRRGDCFEEDTGRCEWCVLQWTLPQPFPLPLPISPSHARDRLEQTGF